MNASICLFQPFRKIRIAGSYEYKPSLALFLFHPYLETMLLSEGLISRIFLKPNWLWFQKNDGKNIEWRQKEMLGKMYKMIKQLLTPFA